MSSIKNLLILILVVSTIAGCSTDDETTVQTDPLAYTALTNVSYGTDPRQVYDIYLPKNRGTESKVMILVHGGGWKEGDKNDMNGFRDFIREQLPNIVVVNINYRLANENNPPHPMQINDITTVVEQLKSKQNDYHIGTELGFMGVSAGGHLSLLWSYAYDTQKRVKMVCSMVGPTNLSDDAYLNSTNQELKDLIFQFGSEVSVLQEVSPLFKVKPDSPPTQLFYGAQDPLIPNSQGIDLNNKLEELNVPHEFTHYPNGGHGWIGLDLLDTSIKLKAFIERYL